MIPDILVGVGEREWLFATEFAYTPNDRPYAQLVFEGLDTICEIWLVSLDPGCSATNSR